MSTPHLLILHVLQLPVELFASSFQLLLRLHQLTNLHFTLVKHLTHLHLIMVSDSTDQRLTLNLLTLLCGNSRKRHGQCTCTHTHAHMPHTHSSTQARTHTHTMHACRHHTLLTNNLLGHSLPNFVATLSAPHRYSHVNQSCILQTKPPVRLK